MYGLHGKLIAKPGQRGALVALLLEAAGGEPMRGCRLYVVSEVASEPRRHRGDRGLGRQRGARRIAPARARPVGHREGAAAHRRDAGGFKLGTSATGTSNAAGVTYVYIALG